MLSTERELKWLRQVRDVSQRLASETEMSTLLPFVLDAAVEITGAERGFLVLLGNGAAKVKEARGFDRTELAREVANISRTVVERVLERQTDGLVTTSERDRDVVDVTSVKERRVVSILCVPLRLRGEIRGVLYLDHRLTRGAFTEADLPILRPFADQAALALDSLGEQAASPADDYSSRTRFGRLVGGAPPMQALYAEIERAARSWTPVMILGERGSGKGLVAREIHDRSERSTQPFLTLACSPGSAPLETELLGHRAGARPWATEDRQGALLSAGRGTLFLDGVDELTPELQVDLLRVLREGRVTPLGSDTPMRVDCRVIVASHQDLRTLAESDRFREDLYFQLDAHRVIAPPLRQHPEDLSLLVDHFARQGPGGSLLKLSPHALELLSAYSWPGNARELENEVGRLLPLSTTTVPGKALSPEIQEGRGVTVGPPNYAGLTLEGVEREVILAALANCKGSKARAARQLGVPRSTLYHLLGRHGL
jgi:transcriptional regulator with GAF, ATPase, and Fis domain